MCNSRVTLHENGEFTFCFFGAALPCPALRCAALSISRPRRSRWLSLARQSGCGPLPGRPFDRKLRGDTPCLWGRFASRSPSAILPALPLADPRTRGPPSPSLRCGSVRAGPGRALFSLRPFWTVRAVSVRTCFRSDVGLFELLERFRDGLCVRL